jgi:uncharacterized protein YjiS (DUF1127 family)
MVVAKGNLSLPQPASARFRLPSIVDDLAAPLRAFRAWRFRQGYRADLRRLLRAGPYLIEDIGLGMDEAMTESRKPFWVA